MATILVGLPSALSYSGVELMVSGMRSIDLMGLTVGNNGLLIAGTIISLVFSWQMEKSQIFQEIGGGGVERSPPLTKYVVPSMPIMVTMLSILQTFFGWWWLA